MQSILCTSGRYLLRTTSHNRIRSAFATTHLKCKYRLSERERRGFVRLSA